VAFEPRGGATGSTVSRRGAVFASDEKGALGEALPGKSLERITQLPSIRWLGRAPSAYRVGFERLTGLPVEFVETLFVALDRLPVKFR
jgi:hypothetical protein